MAGLKLLRSGAWVNVDRNTASNPPSDPRHKYDPSDVVPLSSPTVRTISQSSFGSLGTFSATTDLIIIVDGLITQTSGTTNFLSFNGGRNCWILGVNGAEMRDQRNYSGQKNVIVRQNNYGHTFVDSIFFNAKGSQDVDILVPRGYAPYGTNRADWVYPRLYLQNCRFDGSQWSGGSPHPDCVQKQTAMGSTYIYNCTILFEYQGFLIAGQSFSLDDPNTAGTQQEQWVEGLRDSSGLVPGSPAPVGYGNTVAGEMRLEKTNGVRSDTNYEGPLYWLGWNTAAGNSGFPGENAHSTYFDGEDNWAVGGGGPNAADSLTAGGGLVYPTGSAYDLGSRKYGSAVGSADIARVYNATDGISPYATWVAAANIYGKLRHGARPAGDHVTVASLSGYDSPFAP